MPDQSTWLTNERGAVYAYKTSDGTIVRVWNAQALVANAKRRERAKAREDAK